jgi:uncharacterized RDD family membrane protein YckC
MFINIAGKRFLALLLDSLIVVFGPIIPLRILSELGLRLSLRSMLGIEGSVREYWPGLSWGSKLLWIAAPVVIFLFYGVLFECSGWRATPGKRFLKLSVEARDGSGVTFAKVVGRNVAKALTIFPFPLTVLPCLVVNAILLLSLDGQRGLHDRIAGTRVVARSAT